MNESSYEKAQAIADELTDFLSGESSSLEAYPHLKEYFESDEVALDRLTDCDRVASIQSEIDKISVQKSTANLSTRLKTAPRRPSRKRMLWIASSTVAAMIVLGYILYVTSRDMLKDNIIAVTIIDSTTHVPTLITDNGKKVELPRENNYASVSAVLGDSSTLLQYSDTTVEKFNKLIVPSGYVYTVTLDDGTKVSLNANSELSFPSKFSNTSRSVALKGEAFFEVSKSSIPFMVKTSKVTIKVYGTQFNINLNKEGITETVLVSGSIGATFMGKPEIKIAPNQRIRITDKGVSELDRVDVSRFLGWRNGVFDYEQENLWVVLDELSAWYGVRFIMDHNRAKNIFISLNIDRKTKLETMLSILSSMLDLDFIDEGGGSYIVN